MNKIKYLLWAITLVFCFLTFYSFSAQAQNIMAQVDTSYTGIKNLEVRARFCRVEVGAVSNTDKVEFFGEITGNQGVGKYKFMHQKEGNTLKVWLEGKSSFSIGINIINRSRLMFKIPRGVNVVVENGSGSVRGYGLNGSITHLSAGSGSVKAENINSPKVYMKTGSGSMSGENIGGQDVEFKTGSGGLKIENVSGKTVTARTSSGSQRWANVNGEFATQAGSGGIKIDGIKGNLNVRTGSGTIRVANVKGNVKAKAGSGGIRLNNIQGMLSLTTRSGGISGDGVLLTGNSDFQSGSGGIRMKLKNDLKKLDFDLKAGSGGLRVGGERSGKRLVLRNGNGILITGTSRSGSQRYVSFEGRD
ncbi:hypothetical protein BKI52_17060 [marine bacterium AO1-C]|nr:hypothetical protein BKI52_17060 [marine bacterium AO1-C]